MDEVTGLHAFDHLDPVSALNVLPEEPEETPIPAARPPAPAFRGRSLPPPPPPRGGPAGMSVPPPPQRFGAPASGPSRSFPPPAPAPMKRLSSAPSPSPSRPAPSPSSPSWANARASLNGTRGPRAIADDDLTQRVEMPQRHEDDTRVVDDDMAATGLIQVGDQLHPLSAEGTSPHALMDLSATTVAASIDMDWDEDEEPQTNMRDELSTGGQGRSSSMDFDPVVHVPAAAPASFSPPAAAAARPSLMPPGQRGEPSPFVLASSLAPAAPSWEDDAQTRAYAPEPIAPPAWTRPSTTTQDLMLDDESSMRSRGNLPWFALAAVVAVGLALGVRAMMAPAALATVTLVTQPADAEVSVDGRPLVGQASPFTIQGLAPDAEHTLVVRSEGFGEHSSSFRVEAGETKALPAVELQGTRVDTGFALASQPEGAKVFVDGEARDIVTPARISDLAPGLHTVRLEQPGFQPWETQVAVAAGQVLDLPAAQLAPSKADAAPSVMKLARESGGGDRASSARSGGERKISRAEEQRLERKARRAERRAERAARAAEAKQQKAAAKAARSAVAAAPPAVKPVPAAAGGGVLRVNSRPWAQVFVDGRMIGNTPQLGIQLSPGKHKLKLVNPELGLSKQLAVDIDKGKTTTKVINMIE